MGYMDERDFDTYMGLFDSMMSVVEQPELMIYLRSSVPHLVKISRKEDGNVNRKFHLIIFRGSMLSTKILYGINTKERCS